MKKRTLLLLSLLSGLLLWLSWYPVGLTFLIFVAWVPLFVISDELIKRGAKFSFGQGLLFSFPAFVVWNAATTWWIWHSTPEGSIAAMILNSLFMSLVFATWHFFNKQKMPKLVVPIMFIAFWCSWEFLHLHWDISWPWLSLGNVFAPCTQIVQWYEYTGAFGGTIWVLALNFLFYYFIRAFKNNRKKAYTNLFAFMLTLTIPLVISLIIYHTYTPSDKNPVEAVIVQQNTDPWEEQYEMSNLDHVNRILSVASPLVDEKTDLIICSESAIPNSVNSETILSNEFPPEHHGYMGFEMLDTFMQQYPNLNMITGLSSYSLFDTKVRATAREVGENLFIEFYNTSACINRNGITELYYKSMLVPGVELMPYPAVFGFLEKMVIDLGGTSGSLGKDTSQRAFHTTIQNNSIKIGAPICYESIYGELFTHFIKDGAQLMTVITNDSWWKNSPGHKQHFVVSKLRAVETRRTIMRAANTGISAFIDEKGDEHQRTNYQERLAIKQTVYPNDYLTFYVKHGDYLARFAMAIAALLFLSGIYFWIRKGE